MFAACQKELSFETGNTGQLAAGSLWDTSSNCQPITVHGVYSADSALTDSNYIQVQVSFSTAGNYKVFTNVQNGFSFVDSGFTSSAGTKTIKLKGVGKPVAASLSDFVVTFAYDTSFCLFNVTVLPKVVSGTAAVYGLTSSACVNANVQGTYTKGIALTSANKVVLDVNVTTPGVWNVSTSTVNGMVFSGSGTFTSTGAQTITLQGSGTPVSSGSSTIPVTAGTSSCGFGLTVAPSTGGSTINDADSAWQFSQGNKFFHGSFDDVHFDTDTLSIIGSDATGDTLILVNVMFPGHTIVPGTYSTKAGNAAFVFITATGGGSIIYAATPAFQVVNLQITISFYDAATKIVQGTFTGTILNASGAIVNLTGGKFKAVIT